MKWIRFSEKYPPKENSFLYYDSAEMTIIIAHETFSHYFKSDSYYCNDPKCTYIDDACGCDLIIDPVNDYWMELPLIPLKENTKD